MIIVFLGFGALYYYHHHQFLLILFDVGCPISAVEASEYVKSLAFKQIRMCAAPVQKFHKTPKIPQDTKLDDRHYPQWNTNVAMEHYITLPFL